jgi:collagen type IV alpha-3-binding protein
LEALNNCLDLMQQKEDKFNKQLDLEVEKRKKLEELLRQGASLQHVPVNKSAPGTDATGRKQNGLMYEPDYYEEGPYSKIKEEEFFDAVDAMLDKSDQQEEEKRQLKLRVKELSAPSALPVATCDHPLWPEINQITLNQLYYARLEVGAEPLDDALSDGNANSSWQLFAEEGEMRLYKREVEIDGSVCDPLKAVHTVKGITGQL